MFSKSTIAKILINTLIGFVLIIIWLQFVNIQNILNTLSRLSLISLAPVFISIFLSQAIRAIRLKIFLSPIKKIPLSDLIFLTGLAQALSFLIPIRAGEIAKGVYLSQYGLPLSKSVTWIFLDRLLDFLVVLFLGSMLLLLIPTALNIKFITIIIIILIALLILTYLIIYQVDFARLLFKFLSYLLIVKYIKIQFERIYNFFLESFSILKRKPKELGLLFGITILAYGADGAIWYFTYLSLGVHQEYLKMYLGQLLSALTYLIPSAPGYVGSAEASGLLIFSGVFGIEANLASAMTVLYHIVIALFIITFGVISLYFLKIDLKEILRRVLKK